VATSLDKSEWEPGEIIFRPGDRAHGYFVVLEGQVEVRGEGHGVDQTVVRVNPGELFGDQAALSGQAGAITAHAVTRTVALKVDRSAMRDLLLGSADAPSTQRN
jgi:CRP-like cAMP-binding protein